MKNFLLFLLPLFTLNCFTNDFFENNNQSCAYAADIVYDSSFTNEPNNETQISTTYKWMNVDDTIDHYRGDKVKVAVIDSGLNYDHEDFLNNGKTIMNSQSKYYEYSSSKNQYLYYTPEKGWTTKLDDTYGHGTNVAATIAAQINGVGGYGLASNVDLYVYKVTNSSNGYVFDEINLAIRDAADLGIDIINMSFQSYEQNVSYGSSSMSASQGCSSVMQSAINYAYNKGVTLVAAAGNYNTNVLSYPAANNHVISVGSCEYDSSTDAFVKASYSNYGNVDIVAPGTVYVASSSSNTSYKKNSGTSFSAPLVTAALALYKQKNPDATPQEMENALYASCFEIDETNSSTIGWSGHGSLNLYDFIIGDMSETNINIVDIPTLISVGRSSSFASNHPSFTNWSLSDPSFGNIDKKGNFIPTKEGKVKIIATNSLNEQIFDEIEINILPEIVGLTCSNENISLQVNGEESVSASYLFKDGTTYPLDLNKVVFLVDDESICSIDSNGKIKGLKKGTTTIAIIDEEFLYDILINVSVIDKAVSVSSISLNITSKELYAGESFSLTYTILPIDASNKNVVWSSLDESVATIENGLVTAKNEGSTTILVTTIDGNKTAKCEIIVKNKATPKYKWVLVNSIDQLYDLDQIVIVSNAKNVAAGPSSGKYLTKCDDVTFSTDKTYITSLPSTALNFEIIKRGDKYAIKNIGDNSYLNSTETKNVSFVNDITYCWSISISNGNATISSDKGKILYNSGAPRFTTYSSNTSETMLLPQIYRYVMDENEWSTYFINSLGCDSSGKNSPSVEGWNNSGKKYLGLSLTTQSIIKNAINDENGSIVNNASYIYDFVLNKYGTSNYSNFMNKTINNKSISILENEQFGLIPIIIISSIAILSSIMFVYVYKKRED